MNKTIKSVTKAKSAEVRDWVKVHIDKAGGTIKIYEDIDSKYIKTISEYCKKFDIELKRYKNYSEFNLGR